MDIKRINGLNNILASLVLAGERPHLAHALLDFHGFVYLSSGATRYVYTHPSTPEVVYKVCWQPFYGDEKDSPNANVREHALYNYTTREGIHVGLPLAGVMCISECGNSIAQERITGKMMNPLSDEGVHWEYDGGSAEVEGHIKAAYAAIFPSALNIDLHCNNVMTTDEGMTYVIDYAGAYYGNEW